MEDVVDHGHTLTTTQVLVLSTTQDLVAYEAWAMQMAQ